MALGDQREDREDGKQTEDTWPSALSPTLTCRLVGLHGDLVDPRQVGPAQLGSPHVSGGAGGDRLRKVLW